MENFHSEIVPEPVAPLQHGVLWLKGLLDILETLVIAVGLFAGIDTVSARIRVDGHSMEPTFVTGELLIVNKMAYKLGSIKTGDVIVFHPPNSPTEEYIKRVIGLPGDHVVIKNGKVIVNDQILEEPYIKAPPNYELDIIVDPDGLFVLGDNRNNSNDSHSWGSVPLGNIVGKAEVVYWPPKNWGVINRNQSAVAAP